MSAMATMFQHVMVEAHNGVELMQKFMVLCPCVQRSREYWKVDVNLYSKLLSLEIHYFCLLHFNEINVGVNGRQTAVARFHSATSNAFKFKL